MIPQRYFDMVMLYFGSNAKMTWAWFESPNPWLGEQTPMQMIKAGREKKLMTYIEKNMSVKRKRKV